MVDIKDKIYRIKQELLKAECTEKNGGHCWYNIQNRMVDTKGRIYKNNGKTYKIKWQIVKVEYTK